MKTRGHVTSVIYGMLVPGLQEKARECGYAVAFHGSMVRDFDIVAIPWTDEATEPEVLLDLIADAFSPMVKEQRISSGPEAKPHGRLAWTMPIGCGLYLDISFMPRVPSA